MRIIPISQGWRELVCASLMRIILMSQERRELVYAVSYMHYPISSDTRNFTQTLVCSLPITHINFLPD